MQDAIENRHNLGFYYYAPSGESKGSIEPYYVVFKWINWYVYGWCLKRKDYRSFKLNRMDKVKETEQRFVYRNAPVPDLTSEMSLPRNIILKVLFEPDMKLRLAEEFGSDCYEIIEDGRHFLIQDYSDMSNLIMWMLTFGDKVEVIKPIEVREKLKSIAKSMFKKYGGKASLGRTSS